MSLDPDYDMTEDQIAELEEKFHIQGVEGSGESEGEPYTYVEEEVDELDFT